MMSNLLMIVSLLVAVVLSFSQDIAPAQEAGRPIHLIPYTADGHLLTNCRLQRVGSRDGLVPRDGNRATPQLNQPEDMWISSIPDGVYQVTYRCGDRLHFDEHVSIRPEMRIVLLVDRSGGDHFQFRSGYKQGMRLAWPTPKEPQGSSGFVRWVRLSHLIDAESWTLELVGNESELVFPAKPGRYLLTIASSGESVCVGVVQVVSYASGISVSDSNDCQLDDPNGLRVEGMVRADLSR